MRRIKDYYHWTKLSHWNNALTNGSVTWGQVYCESHVEDVMLYRAYELLVNNCYPFALICCHTHDDKKTIIYTPLWRAVIQFVNGKRNIAINEKKFFFKDLPDNARYAVLNADIQSIWIASDSDNDLSEISIMIKDIRYYA